MKKRVVGKRSPWQTPQPIISLCISFAPPGPFPSPGSRKRSGTLEVNGLMDGRGCPYKSPASRVTFMGGLGKSVSHAEMQQEAPLGVRHSATALP